MNATYYHGSYQGQDVVWARVERAEQGKSNKDFFDRLTLSAEGQKTENIAACAFLFHLNYETTRFTFRGRDDGPFNLDDMGHHASSDYKCFAKLPLILDEGSFSGEGIGSRRFIEVLKRKVEGFSEKDKTWPKEEHFSPIINLVLSEKLITTVFPPIMPNYPLSGCFLERIHSPSTLIRTIANVAGAILLVGDCALVACVEVLFKTATTVYRLYDRVEADYLDVRFNQNRRMPFRRIYSNL